jgi:two-component system, OmpR family, alkaline phosphatase synthesis response regulator PhoP
MLSLEGHQIQTAADGVEGLARAKAGEVDLIILDVMLPKRSGFEVCRELREKGIDTAILMLTARTQIPDRVKGLKLGADDYLAKPFDPQELLARVASLLRRVQKEDRIPLRSYRFGDIEVAFERAEVRRRGEPLNVPGKELQLLRYLVERRGTVVPREEILQKVWTYQSGVSSRTIDVHVAWLRQKIEENPQTPRFIHTIRGKGYRFTP